MTAAPKLTLRRLAIAATIWALAAFLPGVPKATAQRLPLKSYTVADGLPNNVINKIVRDSRGFLWLCTGEGLSRFDGYSFMNYGVDQGLPDRTVNDFLEARNGDLWIATNAGLARFSLLPRSHEFDLQLGHLPHIVPAGIPSVGHPALRRGSQVGLDLLHGGLPLPQVVRLLRQPYRHYDLVLGTGWPPPAPWFRPA